MVDFGSTHVGRTYLEMWEGHQSWIRWFVQHYSKSTKRSHRLMIHFIQCKIERHELTGDKVPLTDGDNLKPVAKSKAQGYVKPMPKAATTSNRWIPPDVMDELDEKWEDLNPELMAQVSQTETQQQLDVLQSRMLHMENALQTILQAVQQQGQQEK